MERRFRSASSCGVSLRFPRLGHCPRPVVAAEPAWRADPEALPDCCPVWSHCLRTEAIDSYLIACRYVSIVESFSPEPGEAAARTEMRWLSSTFELASNKSAVKASGIFVTVEWALNFDTCASNLDSKFLNISFEPRFRFKSAI